VIGASANLAVERCRKTREVNPTDGLGGPLIVSSLEGIRLEVE